MFSQKPRFNQNVNTVANIFITISLIILIFLSRAWWGTTAGSAEEFATEVLLDISIYVTAFLVVGRLILVAMGRVVQFLKNM